MCAKGSPVNCGQEKLFPEVTGNVLHKSYNKLQQKQQYQTTLSSPSCYACFDLSKGHKVTDTTAISS